MTQGSTPGGTFARNRSRTAMTTPTTMVAVTPIAAASPPRPASSRLNNATPSVSVPAVQSKAETVNSLKARRKTSNAPAAAAGSKFGTMI